MVGRSILHYQILEKIGAGGMGEVYKAQDNRLNRFVAIKLLSQAKSDDHDRRRRFIQEAQAASALNHANIITIHDIVSEVDMSCIVMEFVGGKTLVDVIPNGGLRVPQVLSYSVQIADALSAAHAAGIVHRDLKPANIMVTAAGRVKVLDFGLAKLMESSPLGQSNDTVEIDGAPLTVEGAIIGTISYIAPEQAQGKRVDARADIFSFGAVLYEMLTGRPAFAGDSSIAILSAVLRDDPEPIASIAPAVPQQLAAIVERCLRKAPEARWQSMREVEEQLSALKQKSDSGRLTESEIPPVQPRSRKPWALLAVALALVAVGSAAWWRLAHGNAPSRIAPAVTLPAPAPAGAAQTVAAPTPPAPTPIDSRLTNDSILEMVQAKAPVSVILSHIHSSKTNFTLATPEVIRLVKAGVPEVVIEAMRDPKHAGQPPAVTSSPSPASAPAAPPAIAEKGPQATVQAPSAPVPAAQVRAADGLPFKILLDEDIPLDAEPDLSLHFTAGSDLRIGGAVIVLKGASVTGAIVDAGKKKFLGKSKLTFRLLKVDAVDGQTLNVRAAPTRGAIEPPRRQVETGKGSKPKGTAAVKGTEYIAYIEGEQTVTVHR